MYLVLKGIGQTLMYNDQYETTRKPNTAVTIGFFLKDLLSCK